MILLDRMSGLPIEPMTRRQTRAGLALIEAIDPDNQVVTVTIEGWGSGATCDAGFIGGAFYSSVEAFPR